MVKRDSQNRDHPGEWRTLYRAAIFEANRCEISKRLSDAEEAIVRRTRELFTETGATVETERDALDDAKYALEALKVALEHNTRAA